MSRKNESVYLILVEINKKLDKLIDLASTLNETMDEDIYLRSREASPDIFNPQFYDEDK